MPTRCDFPLPPDLPRPVDDGGAAHLRGMPVPAIALPSTSGELIDLSKRTSLRTVAYCYPMTGVPGRPLPEGWDNIPGARGCTPQALGFQEHTGNFAALQAEVFGISTQTSDYQREVKERVGLSFDILSDAQFKFCDALQLPTFQVDGMRLLKRLTLVLRDGHIEHVFYPVFPPNESASEVVQWLRNHRLT
ncbi:MAG TPA: peroxiredoxin [Terriglobales bacterium]